MFESLPYMILQQYCWVIVSLLGGIVILLMFVQGGQTMIYVVGKTPEERKSITDALGRKWTMCFVALAAFAGMLFACFPLFCVASFGGARFLWILILSCFVLQTVLYEFRALQDVLPGKKTYPLLLFFTGITGMILLGTSMGMFFNGAMFSINEMNIARWETPYRGIEAILNPHNLLLGVTVFFLARVLALLFFLNNIKNEQVVTRSKIRLLRNYVTFSLCFVVFLTWLFMKHGYYYNPATEEKEVSMQAHKYLQNLLAMPAVLAMLVAGIASTLTGVVRTLTNSRFTGGIWYAGVGAVITAWALFLIAGFNNTSYYPSLYDLPDSLTIENSSSGYYMLTAMGYLSLVIPVVIALVFWKWRRKNKQKK